MKLKKVMSVIFGVLIFGFILTLIATGLIFGFEEVPPVFAAFHLIALLYAVLLFSFFILLEKFIWILLPKKANKTYENNRSRYKSIVLICFMLFFLGSWAINHYCFDYKINLINILGTFGIAVFALSLGSLFLRPSQGKKIVLSCSGLILLVSILLPFVSLNNHATNNLSSEKALAAFPYAKWIPAGDSIDKIGVIRHNPQKSFKGINIYSSHKSSTAYLLDMTGEVLHAWTAQTDNNQECRLGHIELCKNGDLLGNVPGKKWMVRLDWNSNLKWIREIPSHHDIDMDESGDIYTLTGDFEVVLAGFLPLPIGNEYITILSPNGTVKKKISLYEILKNEIPSDRIQKIIRWLISPKDFVRRLEKVLTPPIDIFDEIHDIFHSNTVEIINKDINSIFKKGNALFCVKHLNLIGVIDLEKERLVWKWGKNDLDWPHHPTLLKNGNILIFDNGTQRKYSRIIELNPHTEEIEWQYVAKLPQSFFSAGMGANQRLPNENTLITESDKGHVFEVTKDGEIVWEFYNPEIKKRRKKRASIYRMMRITDPENYPYLQNLEKN